MKETHYKLKHRVTALFAAAVMLCSMLPGAAFAEEPTPQPTEETVQMEQQTEPSETDNGQTDESSPDPGEDVTEATPETAEEQPAEEEISAAVVGAELYTDLPNAPIGSYIGSEGLPVATGETKIGISEWPESQLEETSGSYLTAAALDNDGLTIATPLLDGADYAIVPIMAQVEYPADGSSTDMILPDGVTLLDFYGEPATDADALLHNSYHETSAAVMGVYVQADADFTAQLVYTAPDGSTQTKTLYVTIDREHTVASPFADAGIAAYGERPIPDVTSGKITKVAKVNGTWLIWFNGEPAYCCTPGADGQPKNCPTYTYVNTSMVGADQYVPGDHYGNQYRIWGGLTQLSLGMQELPPVALSAEAPSLLDFCRTIYTNAQMQIIENYPDSTAAKILIGSAQTLLEGTDAYASARGYYTYIYQPGRAGWQTVAVIGPEISDDEPNPKPIVQEIYANWEAPAQTASGSFDFDYGIITNKVQLKTTEKVDGATIEIEPITKSGTIDGGTWNISPADKQTVTTTGHTNDDNFQNNGGAASASWTLHYSVSKTTDSRSGRVGPYTTQDEADAAADSARDAAIAELQGEAQRMVDNAVASAKAELANVKFRYEEVGVPYGFEMYWGSNGSNQTISVPANSNNAYQMKNDEWSLQVNIKKTDSETGNQIAADAQYEIFQWDTVTGKYQPTGGYNTYSVQRQNDGTYAVINSAAYATTDSMRHTLYYTQRNTGKFIIVESKAPTGYFGDWTDINHPGIANTPLGKRGYYIEITEDSDNSVIWLDNADYNADIATTDKGGTKLVTRTGVETTVTIYDTAKDPSRTYNTDNSGKAANEDSYTITPTDGVMKNDRTLGEISISKVDLDAVRYVGGSAAHGTALASGQTHGDAALDGAVYDLYAAEDITHPDGVTGVVDYSKIVDADGNPIWHTTIRDNSGQWVSDYLPVLKKDHLVASAKIENGWLCFSNLYLGKYYVVERSTGVVIPLRDGALAVSGTYPTVDSRTKAATGQTAALAKNGSGQYTDWVYKNQFSTVSKGKALDGSWTYDAYYLSFADGYLVDEHNYYITPAYSDEGWYVEKTTFADNRQAAGEQIDKTSYSANYHIHADNALAESQDQVAKGNVEISKIVSSSGQSNGLELEGAGFTFFLVSDLSKLKQFEQTRSGSYTLQSILDAYIDKTYDNEHPKWDFSAETQAIAKTYEVNADEIAAYNKTLTAAGENKNGKTEHQLYVTGFHCDPETACMSMELTKRLWEQPTDKGVLAYHIIQSFSPGEATPDQVHEIGCEFARRFLADRFECTVSTHLDKGHLHNHIVVNSVSYADGKMFRNNFDTYYHGIRQVSDELCRENRLSVIETDGKGRSYDEWLSGQAGKPTIRGMVRKDVEQAVAAADSFDGFITELQNMGYTVKYGPRVEHIAVRHKDAQRNIRIDRLDPRFSETALREYYRQLHRMPTEMQQEYRQENAPAKPKWQPTELQPIVRRARYLGKLPRRYPKVSGFMACYYHYCALLRKAYHGKSTKRCYFLLREDFLLFSRYQQQTKFLWENHIETMDELLAYKESAEVKIQQLARQRKVLYRQKREPERAAREEKIKSLTQQMKALRHEVYICSDIETDAAEVQEKLRQAELAAQEERNEVKQDEQRRRSSRSDGAGSLTGYRGGY